MLVKAWPIGILCLVADILLRLEPDGQYITRTSRGGRSDAVLVGLEMPEQVHHRDLA